jgi:hypothetical protein
VTTWPATPDELAREQERIAALAPDPVPLPPLVEGPPLRLGACAAVFGRAGRDGIGWVAAVTEERGALLRAPLRIGGEVVAYRVRTCTGAKPIVAHAGWRTSPETAAELALQACAQARWPEPMREARRIARELRREGFATR